MISLQRFIILSSLALCLSVVDCYSNTPFAGSGNSNLSLSRKGQSADSLTLTTFSGETKIAGFRIYGQEKPIYQTGCPEGLVISDRQSLQLFFVLMDQSLAEYPSYKYRLLKNRIAGDWYHLGTQDNIVLAGLGHGHYTLEVNGITSLGYQSLQPMKMNFEVNAPFHRRDAFILIWIVIGITMVSFFFEFRTRTLRKSNRTLREKEITAKEVLKQKNLLSRRNRNIEDSLKYAQRIQYAMFTSESELQKLFPESFIIQKPKDIVSGDFYWTRKIGQRIFLAAADCTGHGVPGAFMSLIGLEFFRQIIENQGLHKPAQILNEINRNFDHVFGNMDDINLRDGMDLSFCVIDTQTNKLEFSGAFNPLYIIRDGEIIEIKGDKTILGPNLGFGQRTFTNHEIQLREEDSLYMFSDGYADQFGGPEGKKFKYRRFRHLLLSIYNQPMELQKQVLESSINDWKGSHEQVDDILVLGVKPIQKMASGFIQQRSNTLNQVIHLERFA